MTSSALKKSELEQIRAERLREDKKYRRGSQLVKEDEIRKVNIFLDSQDDFVVTFETQVRRYALVVMLQKKSSLTYLECQALGGVLEIARRGDMMTNNRFARSISHLEIYHLETGPTYHDGYMYAVFKPGFQAGDLAPKSDIVASLGLAIDEKGNSIQFTAKVGGRTFIVKIELFGEPGSLSELDTDAFTKVIDMLETNSEMNRAMFDERCRELSKKFVVLSEATTSSKHIVTVIIPTNVRIETTEGELNRSAGLEEQQISQQAERNPTEGSQSPFEGVKYKELLTESGQARVYKGVQAGRNVAVKQYTGNRTSVAFQRELKIRWKLPHHPNVVEIYDFFTNPPAVVFPLIDGRDLYETLRILEAPLTNEKVRSIARGIAAGLKHLHVFGVAHRDVKSPNIMLEVNRQVDETSADRYRPVIIDFGLSEPLDDELFRKKPLSVDAPGLLMTVEMDENGESSKFEAQKITENTKGSELWMAPEMIRSRISGAKLDVYAFGIVLWELCSGERPFHHLLSSRNMTRGVLRQCILNGTRPQLDLAKRSGDQELISLISRCWDGDPHKRPSMAAVDAQLNNKPSPKELTLSEFVVLVKNHEVMTQEEAQDMFKRLVGKDGSSASQERVEEFLRICRSAGRPEAERFFRIKNAEEMLDLYFRDRETLGGLASRPQHVDQARSPR